MGRELIQAEAFFSSFFNGNSDFPDDGFRQNPQGSANCDFSA
jgi:hypothetical protein